MASATRSQRKRTLSNEALENDRKRRSLSPSSSVSGDRQTRNRLSLPDKIQDCKNTKGGKGEVTPGTIGLRDSSQKSVSSTRQSRRRTPRLDEPSTSQCTNQEASETNASKNLKDSEMSSDPRLEKKLSPLKTVTVEKLFDVKPMESQDSSTGKVQAGSLSPPKILVTDEGNKLMVDEGTDVGPVEAIPKKKLRSLSPGCEISPPPMKTSSTSKRRKSRRRSSFVVGRKSHGVGGLAMSELCLAIPKDLPDEERLARLQQLLIQHTIQKLEVEAAENDDDGFLEFKFKALEMTETLIENMKKNGDFREACLPSDRALPNPINIRNEGIRQNFLSSIERLTKERDKWEELLKKREDLARKAKREYEEQDHEVKMTRPSTLSQVQKKILDGHSNYKKIFEETAGKHDIVVKSVDKIFKTAKMMSTYYKRADNFIRNQSKITKSHMVKDLPDPRETISALTANKSTT